MDPDKAQFISDMAPFIVAIVAVSMAAWVITTWMRIKNGYPLEDSWGQSVQPQVDRESKEQIKLLSQENDQLRDELASFKNRLATIETIVTDRGYSLDQEIERLRTKAD